METATDARTVNIEFASWRASIQLRTIPILVFLAFQLLLNLSIATFLEVKGDEVAGCVVGSVFSQIVLIAIWCTLVPIHFVKRYLIGSALFGLSAICMFCCAWRDGGGGSRTAVMIAAAMFAQWLIYQMPLWHARWKGWYVSNHQLDELADSVTGNDLQFGISQLLFWTTIMAILLGVTRALITVIGDDLNAGGFGELDMFLTMALGNSLLVLPLVYACFSRQRMLLWLGIACCWAVFVSIAQVMFNGRVDDFLVMMNVVQVVVVFLTLMLVRLAGVRLYRHAV